MGSKATAWSLALLGASALSGLCRAQPEALAHSSSQPAVSPMGPSTTAPGPAAQVALEIGQGQESWGRIVLELYPDQAPLTVHNFLGYVDEGFYDGTIFHRVIPGFIIQGGGYISLTEERRNGLHRPVRNEARNGLKNLRGTIAMARARDPHSAQSQFFINLDDNPKLDYPGPDGWGYCVFGKVIEGMDVVDRIARVERRPHPTLSVDTTPSQPVDPPLIKRAYRLAGPAAAGPATSGSPQAREAHMGGPEDLTLPPDDDAERRRGRQEAAGQEQGG